MDGGPDVVHEVLHALAGVALLEPLLDGVAVARRARAAEGEQAQAQPLLEQALLDVVVAAVPALLDHDLLAQALVARLFLDDLAHDVPVGGIRAVLVLAELPAP